MRDPWGGPRVAVATAVCAAQVPVAGLVAFVLSLDDDSYGAAEGGAFGLVCVALFLPLLLPLIGLLHACVQVTPATAIGRGALRKAGRGPEWAWVLGAQLLPGLGWGLLFTVFGGPFVEPALWGAASGVLPAFAVAYWERRVSEGPVRLRRIWFRSGFASVGLCVALVAVAVLATVTGVLKEYEPPRLGAEQVAGVWRGEDGDRAVLRLGADGRAELTGLPYEGSSPTSDADGGLSRCDAAGTWTFGVDEVEGRPVITLETDGCGGVHDWTIGGTEDDPELFVAFGDLDSPDVRILEKG